MVELVSPNVELVDSIDAVHIMKNIEKAARNCYKSGDKITEDVSSAQKIITMLLSKHHEAMIEFSGNIDVVFTTDIGAQRDISRHRHISMACESTRYCSYNKDKFGNQIKVIKPCNIQEGTPEYDIWLKAVNNAEQSYMEMARIDGIKPDQLRMMLPLSTACTYYVSCNLREWRHIIRLRASSAAHPSVQMVMKQLLQMFRDNGLGLFFEDIEV